MSTKNLRNPSLLIPSKTIIEDGKPIEIPERRIKYLDDRVLPSEIENIAKMANLSEDQKLRLQIASDPVLWASLYLVNPEDHTKPLELRFYQRDMLQTPSRFKILRFGRQTGKCITGDTLVSLSDGSYATAEELYNKYGKNEILPFDVVSYNNGELEVQPAFITFNGVEECLEFETKRGNTLTVTNNHKMRVCAEDGCNVKDIPACEVTENDFMIAVNSLFKFNRGAKAEDNQTDTFENLTELDCTLLGLMLLHGVADYDTVFEIFQNRHSDRISKFLDEYQENSQGVKIYKETKKHIRYRVAYTSTPNRVLQFLDKYDLVPYDGSQKLPTIFYKMPYKFTLAFVRGLCLGEYSLYKLKGEGYHLRIHTRQRILTECVINMLNRFGFGARRKQWWADQVVGATQEVLQYEAFQVVVVDQTHIAVLMNYMKVLPEEELDGFKATICSALEKDVSEYDNIMQSRSRIYDYSRVIRITKTKPVKTYNIQVENTHTYIANGLVTNNSVVLSTDILWRAINTSQYKILIVTPMLEQVKTIFNRIRSLMAGNSLVGKMLVRDKDNPPYLEFSNGSSIKGFVAGDGPRGQSANALYYDESDYIADEIKENIHPVVFNFPDHVIVEASTPSGKRSEFYRKCVDDNEYVEFYWPSHASPAWTPETDAIYKQTHSAQAYVHEVLAEFGSPESGVFRGADIDIALQQSHLIHEHDAAGKEYTRSYTAGEIKKMLVDNFEGKPDRPKIIFGIDWNGAENGTQIVIIGCADKIYVMDVVTIGGSEFTQTEAVERIVALNSVYNPDWIYVDTGYGGMQIETLHLYGRKHPGTRLDKKVVGIDFGSSIEIPDKVTGQTSKKLMKPLMIDRYQRLLEEHKIVIPDIENKQNGLAEQMRNFEIDRYAADGTPIYGHSTPDHKVMAATLALFAFSQKVELIDSYEYIVGTGMVSKHLTERLHIESVRAGAFVRRKLDELEPGLSADYAPQRTIASVAKMDIPYCGIVPQDGRVTDPMPQPKRHRETFESDGYGIRGRSRQGRRTRDTF